MKNRITKSWLLIFISVCIFLTIISFGYSLIGWDEFLYVKSGNPFLLQWQEYLTWHGRFLTHTLLRIILQNGESFTFISRSFIILFILITFTNCIKFRFYQQNTKESYFVFSLISFLLLLCLSGMYSPLYNTPVMMSNFFAMALIAVFITSYSRLLFDTIPNISYTYILITGFLAGASHEQAVAIAPMLIILYVFLKLTKKDILLGIGVDLEHFL